MSNPLLSELALETQRLAGLGFMACTGGNVSVRLPEAEFTVAVSVSGVDKGRLTAADFLLVGADGRPRAGDQRKPSDETVLHLRLYEATGCGAVCHGHPTYAVVLSLGAADHVRFHGIEMQKAFAGTTTHACERLLPVVDNDQDMQRLSDRVLAARRPEVPAVLVRGHGVYAWGRTVKEAGRHLETVEWLCRVAYLARGLATG
jgi:methylthioribulose-1-phosphate dehydratase